MTGNREFKSDVFSMLLEDKRNALQLYNAMNGSEYDDPEQVEMCRLDGGFSLTVRNDAAFVVDMNLNVYEHQSTVCPNMPLRNVFYFAKILEHRVKNRDIFSRTLVKIPTPRFAVFYNGTEAQPEQYDMRLSDAFEHPTEKPEVELICRMYNINRGNNKILLDKCTMLKEYMIFVDYVRQNKSESQEELADAIEKAIDRCISENVLRDFLKEHRAEVVKTMALDYTFERRIELQREEAWDEGFADGKEDGIKIGKEDGLKTGTLYGKIQVYMQEMHLPVEEVAKRLSVNTETVEKILAEMK
jgi:DNA-binding XRE family transcriptional regulator